MNIVPRLALGAGTCFLVLCGFLLFQAESSTVEISPTAETGDSLDFEVNRSANLDKQLACLRHIMSVKEQIVSDLIEGRLTVAEAGTWFHELEKITPGANHQIFQSAYPGATDAERYCRQVIERAVQMDVSDPLKHEALRSRLETEFLGGTAMLTKCTVSGNSAGYTGGGLANYGYATLTNCTVSGNSAGSGGGLFNYRGTATLIKCSSCFGRILKQK